MNETEYWKRLEYRIDKEFGKIDAYSRLGIWCDGFIAHKFDFESTPECVHGTAWICENDDQKPWEYTLVLAGNPVDQKSVDWEMQWRPDDEMLWIDLDFGKHHIEIRPAESEP